MPFTFSHPAAVLPLRRCRLAFSALVIGSMAPDFEYFFRLTNLGRTSHHFPGVITFTLPAALAVLVIFHWLVKWPVISLLPRGWQARMVGPARQFRWWPPANLLKIVLSLAIGIATHVLADGFTHGDGWAATYWPVLRHYVLLAPGYPFPIFKLLQFGSTLLGAGILAGYFIQWYRQAPQDDNLPPQFSPAISATILGAMLVGAVTVGLLNGTAASAAFVQGLTYWIRFTIGFVVASTSVAAFELFGFSLIWRMFLARNHSRQAARVLSDH